MLHILLLIGSSCELFLSWKGVRVARSAKIRVSHVLSPFYHELERDTF